MVNAEWIAAGRSPLASVYRRHEQEKKRHYEERVREVERATFTPLVMSTTGGMGRAGRWVYTEEPWRNVADATEPARVGVVLVQRLANSVPTASRVSWGPVQTSVQHSPQASLLLSYLSRRTPPIFRSRQMPRSKEILQPRQGQIAIPIPPAPICKHRVSISRRLNPRVPFNAHHNSRLISP